MTPIRSSIRGRSRRISRLVPVVVVGLLACSCGLAGGAASSPSASGQTGHSGRSSTPGQPGQSHTGPSSTATLPPTTSTTTTTTVPAEAGWTVVAREATGVAVDEQTVQLSDGATVTVIRFRSGQVHFDLHDGATDPPSNGITLGANAQSVVSAAERPILLAAFNGGFKVTTGSGGFEVNGHVLTPLLPGMATMVINASGAAAIGVWGTPGFPASTQQIVSARQNLPPLVQNGQASPNITDVTAWGAMLGPGPAVARSALGEDANGDLMYAASMSAVPADLASALIGAGAVVAMELDINPYWVQLDAAAVPGGTLTAQIPGQQRPADQYLVGWTRDFVAVLAGGVPPMAPG